MLLLVKNVSSRFQTGHLCLGGESPKTGVMSLNDLCERKQKKYLKAKCITFGNI